MRLVIARHFRIFGVSRAKARAADCKQIGSRRPNVPDTSASDHSRFESITTTQVSNSSIDPTSGTSSASSGLSVASVSSSRTRISTEQHMWKVEDGFVAVGTDESRTLARVSGSAVRPDRAARARYPRPRSLRPPAASRFTQSLRLKPQMRRARVSIDPVLAKAHLLRRLRRPPVRSCDVVRSGSAAAVCRTLRKRPTRSSRAMKRSTLRYPRILRPRRILSSRSKAPPPPSNHALPRSTPPRRRPRSSRITSLPTSARPSPRPPALRARRPRGPERASRSPAPSYARSTRTCAPVRAIPAALRRDAACKASDPIPVPIPDFCPAPPFAVQPRGPECTSRRLRGRRVRAACGVPLAPCFSSAPSPARPASPVPIPPETQMPRPLPTPCAPAANEHRRIRRARPFDRSRRELPSPLRRADRVGAAGSRQTRVTQVLREALGPVRRNAHCAAQPNHQRRPLPPTRRSCPPPEPSACLPS
ncbi:hypothetical protein B0H15DRAFT_953978 [Mycena belliarum]|uniref:Uncharacterized protein n=1 Tax=Mycena belliarum TaxID=1033014 RepID=A0AAD6TYC3_9AGAR|nr:hypothetical protein B0H15DRAFT_953978 [Mycena belliae]